MTGETNENAGLGMGSLLKRYREAHGVTQRELATAAGLSVGALRDLEQGRTRYPRWGMVEELTAALGLGQAQRAELSRVWRNAGAGASRRMTRRSRGLCIQVLGPLTAWRDGAPVELGSARQRAVLGLLALHYDTGLHRNAIIDLLWGERPPASAVPEVQGYVSRLRKILSDGPRRTAITTVGSCRYHLKVGAGQIQLDLTAFRQATREARSALTTPARACDMYEQALGMWCGDLLADVDLLRGHPAAIEVTRQHAEMVLDYAEAALLAGVPGRALPHLRRLCDGEPLNEHAHARLMVALAATGQQAAALQVFEELRSLLDTEFGILPSPVLVRAHAAVLRQTDCAAVSFLSRTGVVRAPA
jgi:DNA-binding SARP family transcriptional activator/transcriptional regulator with XRE-family HTH domain